MAEREVTVDLTTLPVCPAHGIPAYFTETGWHHTATGAVCVGPDAARDKRVADRRAADREKARRALDAWFQSVDDSTVPWSALMAEKWGELLRTTESYASPAERASYRPVAHKSHYVATRSDEETHALDHWNRGIVRPGCRYCEQRQNPDYGRSGDE